VQCQRFLVVALPRLSETIDEIPARFPRLRHLPSGDLFQMHGWMHGQMRDRMRGWMSGPRQRVLQRILLLHPLMRPKVLLEVGVDREMVEPLELTVTLSGRRRAPRETGI
jgi:hypothetical protein